MKLFYIYTNLTKDPNLAFTNQICTYLKEKGCEAVIIDHDNEYGQEVSQVDRIQGNQKIEINEKANGIIVLGGDGTLLKAARDTAESNIPLIGINLGTLGFLAEVEKQDIYVCLNHLIQGDYKVEKRLLLDGEVIRDGKSVFQTHALNDVVVNRFGPLMVLSYDVIVNGQLLNKYLADGIIVSTPTGSTGYNLSAGGPIVEPGAQLMVLTPICPHTLNSRSIILSADDTIEIVIGEGRDGQNQQADVNFDGSMAFRLQTGDKIRVKKSQQVIGLLRIGKESFLKTLHKKMSENEYE